MVAQIVDKRWRIERPLREGGQAHTFLVTDLQTQERAVLKRLKNNNRLPRFEQEVSAIRTIDNPHVLRLIDANTATEKPYLVSEYCELGSLEDNKVVLLQLSLDQRLELFVQIAHGIAAAHAKGIVHRDLKPGNIFLRTLRDAVVGDFGVCFIDAPERLTETIEAVGARYYMAPELAEGRAEEVTRKADTYSLGKVLYWLLTGKVFDREEHRRNDRLLTNFYREDSILHVHQLLDRMVVYEQDRRFPDGSALVANVQEVRRLIREKYPTLEHPPRQCRYCGIGTYKRVSDSDDRSAVFQFGLEPTNTVPHIFACRHCGHVEMFRPGYSSNENWL